MPAITAADVNELRKRTNAPMMDCKKALTEADGDMNKAVDILRSKIKDIIDKKGERETAEGRIAVFIDPATKTGSIIEVRCESAPVAKNDEFVKLCNDIAKQVALKGGDSIEAILAQPLHDNPSKKVSERIADVIGLIRENMKLARAKRAQGTLGSYIHHDGSVGALIEVEGDKADTQLLKEVCMHITFSAPQYSRREDVPADIKNKELEIAKAQIAEDPKNKNKPANILEKIAEGKLGTWYKTHVLLDQEFVKDPSKGSVGDLLKSAGLKYKGHTRYKVGEAAS
jgi:elongation factor Ts